MKNIQSIGVCGSGIMGHGIAQVAAMAHCRVTLADVADDVLDNAFKKISDSLEKLESKDKLGGQRSSDVLARITRTSDVAEMARDQDFIIEAVPEDLEMKREMFRLLDELAPERTVLATNTSQFSITAIAAATKRPERVVGMHWFSPAVLMRLVEVVRGLETSDETIDATLGLARHFGKDPILCRRDSPGFVTTRIIAVLTNEAQRLVEEGLASSEDVDKACKLAFGHPMGPFETADLTGLDTQLRVREALCAAHGERFRPTNLLRTLVNAGHLGRKTGRGFYRYDT